MQRLIRWITINNVDLIYRINSKTNIMLCLWYCVVIIFRMNFISLKFNSTEFRVGISFLICTDYWPLLYSYYIMQIMWYYITRNPVIIEHKNYFSLKIYRFPIPKSHSLKDTNRYIIINICNRKLTSDIHFHGRIHSIFRKTYFLLLSFSGLNHFEIYEPFYMICIYCYLLFITIEF